MKGWTGDVCMMAGHRERGCASFDTPLHQELMKQGYGISYVPGPTDRELAEETANDRELALDEFHGMAPGEIMELYGK